MNILGIDIGTTTVTALILDTDTKTVLKSCTLSNDSFIQGKHFEKLQDPMIILNTVKKAVSVVCEDIEPHTIGVTGQMHGILYLDKDFKPCSPLMIWQDERGNEIYEDNETYAEFLSRETNYKSATGFGLTTHFYNINNKLVPENAVMLSTIHDYLVSVLTDSKPVTHSSDGASLGLFNLDDLCFDEEALNCVGIDKSFLPEVIADTALAGTTHCDFLPDGIPVSVAIGDNQASFLGSVSDPKGSVLVNVGTGSQVSFMTNSTQTHVGEIRPLTEDKYIFVGSSLCGGRAYATLKSFFKLCAQFLGGSEEDLYKKMDALSEDIFSLKNPLNVNCEFSGSRENPLKRGFIENIGTDNFTPTHLVCGILTGVCTELFDFYIKARKPQGFIPKAIVCSGNGLRKSAIWREIFSRQFHMQASLPKHSEEAAIGACVFSSAASGIHKNIADAQQNLLR